MKQTDKGVWVIGDANDADLFERIASGRSWVAGIDVETRPLDGKRKTPKAWIDPLVGIGVSLYEDIPDAFDSEAIATYYGSSDAPGYIEAVRKVMAGRKWYAHNAMFDAQVLRRYGIILGEHVGDPRIIAYLLGQPEAGLKPLLAQYMGYDIAEYADILAEWKVTDLRGVPVEVVADYCGKQDAEQVVRLERLMREELRAQAPKAYDVYTKVELPMVPVLVEMTRKGIRFNREEAAVRYTKTHKGREGLDGVIDTVVKADGFVEYEKRTGKTWYPTCKGCRNGKVKRVGCLTCKGAGKFPPVPMTFNPGSWQQRERLLYEHLGIPKRRFAGGIPPWQVHSGWYDEEEVAGATDTLALLQVKDKHPVISLMLTRATLAKDEGFLAKWGEFSVEDGRLHTEFTNTTVASGRLSSREPNLQQVTRRFRDLFLADEDTVLVAGDMSQLELVIAAYMSRDETMIEILRQGWDMHRITAEAIYGVPWRDIATDSPMRFVSKVANYLSNYGGQKQKFQEGVEKDALLKPELGIVVPNLAECSRILLAHKRKYTGYWSWVERIKGKTLVTGYSETAFGRPRFFPLIDSPRRDDSGEAERAAVNHCVDYETEVLSTRGWLTGHNVRMGDVVATVSPETLQTEWETVREIIYQQNQPVVEFKNKSLSAMSTLQHRWLVETRCSSKDRTKHQRHFVTTNNMNTTGEDRIIRCGLPVKQAGSHWTDDEVEVLGWVLTDGHYVGTNGLGISQSKPHNVARLDALTARLRALGWTISRSAPRPTGQIIWNIYVNQWTKLIRRILPDKTLSVSFLTLLSSSQLRLLYDVMMLGDGCWDGTFWAGRDQQRADVMQALQALIGISSTRNTYAPRVSNGLNNPRGNGGFIVRSLRRQRVQVLAQHRMDKGLQDVWCIRVPNGTFIARRRGTVYVTGNCVQGTAADLMKMAMVNISRDKLMSSWGSMVLQVHDEIVSIVKREYLTEYVARLRVHMELGQPFEPIVPLTVDIGWGDDWGSTHK